MWRVVTCNELKQRHVMPVEDLREHEVTLSCWCHPVQDWEDSTVIAHNAMDQRELIETGERRVQ